MELQDSPVTTVSESTARVIHSSVRPLFPFIRPIIRMRYTGIEWDGVRHQKCLDVWEGHLFIHLHNRLHQKENPM